MRGEMCRFPNRYNEMALHEWEVRGLIYWCTGFKGKRRASRPRKWQTAVCMGKCKARPEKREKGRRMRLV